MHLDWIIFSPTQLNDYPAAGKVRIQVQGRDFSSGPYQISRAALAFVLLDAVESAENDRMIF
jgi:hypothetical protein